jgi:hypothetical protein
VFALAFSFEGGKVVESDLDSLSGKELRVMSTHSSPTQSSSLIIDPGTYVFALAFLFEGGRVVERDFDSLSEKEICEISTPALSFECFERVGRKSETLSLDPGTYVFALAFSFEGGKVVESDLDSLSENELRVISTHSSPTQLSSLLFDPGTYEFCLAFLFEGGRVVESDLDFLSEKELREISKALSPTKSSSPGLSEFWLFCCIDLPTFDGGRVVDIE